jgi:hypothetical protein
MVVIAGGEPIGFAREDLETCQKGTSSVETVCFHTARGGTGQVLISGYCQALKYAALLKIRPIELKIRCHLKCSLKGGTSRCKKLRA